MMHDLNSATVTGKLINDPEISRGDGNKVIARFTIASQTRTRDENQLDRWLEEISYIPVSASGWVAEKAEWQLEKGLWVVAHGRIHTLAYQNDLGETRYEFEITLNDFSTCLSRNRPRKPAQSEIASSYLMAFTPGKNYKPIS